VTTSNGLGIEARQHDVALACFDIEHVRGAPYHPQTQGKIERWHQTLKNRILLNNFYLPGDLERQIGASSNTIIPLSRKHQQSNPGRRLLWKGRDDPR
jgi:transposase InsO family protein